MVVFPGCPGKASAGEKWTFSRAAVVIVDEVVVLIPFMTLRGGDWPALS
jgi:hypothetical protein